MKFMIKHNIPLVRGGSLWQYRSVPPSFNLATPLPPNVNPRTATATGSGSIVRIEFWCILINFGRLWASVIGLIVYTSSVVIRELSVSKSHQKFSFNFALLP